MKWFLALIISFLISGCVTTKVTDTKYVTVTETIDNKVAVKCEIPKVECEFSGQGVVPGQKLLKCIVLQKKIIEACTKQIEE